MPSAIAAVKGYLVDTLLPGLFPAPVVVTYGLPSRDQADDIVSVLGVRATAGLPVMSPARPNEEHLDVEVRISCYRAGGDEAQRSATEAACGLLSTLRDRFKVQGQETLGGAVREARVTAYELTEDEDDDTSTGRLSQMAVTLTVKARN